VAGPVAGQAATAVLPAGAAPAEITKVEVLQVRTRAYDRWGCPGAIRETRGALESRSYCSRTSVCCCYIVTKHSLRYYVHYVRFGITLIVKPKNFIVVLVSALFCSELQ
jgi:hypothetical protein